MLIWPKMNMHDSSAIANLFGKFYYDSFNGFYLTNKQRTSTGHQNRYRNDVRKSSVLRSICFCAATRLFLATLLSRISYQGGVSKNQG